MIIRRPDDCNQRSAGKAAGRIGKRTMIDRRAVVERQQRTFLDRHRHKVFAGNDTRSAGVNGVDSPE